MAGGYRLEIAVAASRQTAPPAGTDFESARRPESGILESIGWKWSACRRIALRVGAPLQRTNRKYLINPETARLAWISLEPFSRGPFGQSTV